MVRSFDRSIPSTRDVLRARPSRAKGAASTRFDATRRALPRARARPPIRSRARPPVATRRSNARSVAGWRPTGQSVTLKS